MPEHQGAKLINQATDIYKTLGIKETVSELRENVDEDIFRDSFNTLVVKDREKVDSFKVFESIRKTDKDCVYFHIPFCSVKCSYCIYEKIGGSSKQERSAYLDCLRREIESKSRILKGNLTPDIFYVGGGTPTILTIDETKLFLEMVTGSFRTKGNLEFTIETTPSALSQPDSLEKLSLLKEKGVNRVNVGIQSFCEEVTRENGRIQPAADIYKCFENLREIGFQKINLDLIYGLIGQDLSVWAEDLRKTVELSPDSITTFEMRIRKSAPHYSRYVETPGIFPSEENRLIMRIMALNYFSDNGYFEDNSDYFIRSKEKKYMYHPAQPHNIFRNLIGFGSSAYSLAGNRQMFNVSDTRKYMERIKNGIDPIDCMILLNKNAHMRKRFADGLRTEFDDKIFKKEFSESVFDALPAIVDKLRDMGLVIIKGAKISLTEKGRLITDSAANYINYHQ